jgi:hypothetical protein
MNSSRITALSESALSLIVFRESRAKYGKKGGTILDQAVVIERHDRQQEVLRSQVSQFAGRLRTDRSVVGNCEDFFRLKKQVKRNISFHT